MLLNCDSECRAGRAVAAPPRRRRPRGRGWAGLIRVPGCHFSVGERQRLQSVQWFGRGARGGGAHGGAWGAVLGRQRRNADDVPFNGTSAEGGRLPRAAGKDKSKIRWPLTLSSEGPAFFK